MERPDNPIAKTGQLIQMAPLQRQPKILARRIQRQIERLLKREELSSTQAKYLAQLYKQKQRLTRPLTFVG